MNRIALAGFGDRLANAVRRCRNPVVVGLDPRIASLPESLRVADCADYSQQATAYETFCREIIDVVASLVPAVKPQSAFFEQLGPAGAVALSNVVRYAADQGLLVILDGKRSDIGSTAMAYAAAYLGRDQSVWGADALTVSPYLGDDSLRPFVETCESRGAGIFVLVKTSNPGSGCFQDQRIAGSPLYQLVGSVVEQLSAPTAGTSGYGCVGAVVGATYPDQLVEMREKMPSCWILVPGFGSQGGKAKDVAGAFDANGLGAVINSSRAIIFAYQDDPYRARFGPSRWQAAVEQATRDMIEALWAETFAARLSGD